MKRVAVQIPGTDQKEYPVFIGRDVLKDAASLIDCVRYTKAVIVTDRNIPTEFLDTLTAGLPFETSTYTIAPGEDHKNIDAVAEVWRVLHTARADRKSVLINVGGGVVGDIGGFAAATYMRGIDFIQGPTTPVSQVDSSVGGKTGIDFDTVKNLVGAFAQPAAVMIDVDTLKTLPPREFVSGFGEIIKHGLIRDAEYFRFVTSKKPLEFDADEMVEVIGRSVAIKAEVVSGDEKEAHERKILNFGHTVGHAVESLSLGTPGALLHGEAVAIGMAAQGRIAWKLGILTSEARDTAIASFTNAGLPIAIPQRMETPAIMEKMRSDKKNVKGETRFSLVTDIGTSVYDKAASDEAVMKALEETR